jgi:hypothetical protein
MFLLYLSPVQDRWNRTCRRRQNFAYVVGVYVLQLLWIWPPDLFRFRIDSERLNSLVFLGLETAHLKTAADTGQPNIYIVCTGCTCAPSGIRKRNSSVRPFRDLFNLDYAATVADFCSTSWYACTDLSKITLYGILFILYFSYFCCLLQASVSRSY